MLCSRDQTHGRRCLRRALGLVAAMLLAATAVGGDVTRVVVEDFESPKPWRTWAGDSAPLPSGGLRAVTDRPHGGARCGSFFFDTSCRHGYVAGELGYPFPPDVTAIRFWARTDGSVRLTVRALDSSGQTHQISVPQHKGDWRRVVLDTTKPWPHHFGGANDGVMHQPFTTIYFLRETGSDPEKGTIYIDDLDVLTTASAELVRQGLMKHYWESFVVTLKTDVPGNLFYPGKPTRGVLTVPPTPDASDVEIGGQLFDAAGAVVSSLPPVALNPGNDFSAPVQLPDGPGFYRVALEAGAGEGAKRAETRYAVIPSNSALDRRDPDSPFGVNTHFNQGWPADSGAIAKRAGVAWIRDGEASLEDRALPVAKANQLCYLPCFTHWRGPLAARFREKLQQAGGAVPAWDFTDVVDWHRKYAEKYGDDVECYDLMNEPHGPWSQVLGGGWYGGKWLETFAQFGRQVTEAIHEADPGAKVLWEDVDQLMWYKRFPELGVGETIDGISPHPYNLHRSRPLPEEQPTISQLPDYHAFVRRHNLRWMLWSGEVGFSSFTLAETTGAGFYTPHSELEQAQMLVRMMVVQLANGVEKIFWYDFRNDGWDPHNPEHNFGLIRHDGTPKPAVVAYANLAHRLTGAGWLGEYGIGGGADAYVCTTGETGDPLLIAWVRRGARTEPVPVASDVPVVAVTDIFGATQTVSVRGHSLRLELTESPVYVSGLTPEDVQPFLTRTVR